MFVVLSRLEMRPVGRLLGGSGHVRNSARHPPRVAVLLRAAANPATSGISQQGVRASEGPAC